jgi:MinD-like ATPase involved in chromosome partitioning or flagellar assembly
MSGFVCPKCGAKTNIFKSGGGQKISDELGVPLLGVIPIDPKVCEDSDEGVPFIIRHKNSPASKAFLEIVNKIEKFVKIHENRNQTNLSLKGGKN